MGRALIQEMFQGRGHEYGGCWCQVGEGVVGIGSCQENG